MTIRWVVVADRTEARIYEHRGPGKGLHLLHTLEHPESRIKDQAWYADAPGVRRSDAGAKRNTTDPTESYQRVQAERFARQIADVLGQGRNQGAFDKLVLAAEPRFLGMLREALDGPTASLVDATLPKDLTHADERRLSEALGSVMPV